MKRLSFTPPLVAPLLGCWLACATLNEPQTVTVSQDAETNIQRGLRSLEDKNYEEARQYFEYVTSKYPFLEAAKIAELRLADTSYEKEEYPEARDKYQQFIKLHPTHSEVDYAAFRAALTHYQEIPKDFFLLPPSREKDQTPVRASLRALEDFVRQYGSSKYLEEGKKYVLDVRRRLADHEMYAAEFYAKRGKWVAVLGRLNNVVETYPGVGLDEEAYFGIHRAYLELKDEGRAKDTLKRIITKLPGTPAAERAQKLLGG